MYPSLILGAVILVFHLVVVAIFWRQECRDEAANDRNSIDCGQNRPPSEATRQD